MIRRFFIAMMLLTFGLPGFVGAAGEEKTINLSLEDCIVMAMRNNLGVAIAVLNPEFGARGVSLAKEKFMPVFSFGYSRYDESQASYSWFNAEEEVDQVYSILSAEYRHLFATGGDLSVEFDTSKYDTNERAITINPSYRSQLKFNFRQPLLKDFGPKTARKEIIIAQHTLDIMRKDLEKTLQEIVYGVEEAFWNLVYASENLKIKEGSLKLAQDLLERNKKAVKAETMASVNVLNAQAQVASREADILKAEAEVKNAEDQLKLVINLAAENKEADVLQIIPQGTSPAEKKDMTLEEALAIALQNRPDLEALRIGIRTGEVNVGYARNQALPNLSFSASLWSPGVSGTSLIYPESDPFGDPIGRIPGGRFDSLKDAFGFKYTNFSFGFTLDIPLSGLKSRAAYAQAKINLAQSSLELEKLKQEVLTKIKIALRETGMNYLRIQALKTARELAQKQLAAEEEKLRAGYSTTYFVLQYQSELSLQQSQELEATIEYDLSLARLSRELGTSLVENKIRIDEMPKK
jgi:outer membrane protein TolC